MIRLIDANSLIKYLEKVTVTEGITFETGFRQIIADIKSEPTIDAIPVQWIDDWMRKNAFYRIAIKMMLHDFRVEQKIKRKQYEREHRNIL